MAETVYILCALTSLACAVLLWRGYKQSRAKFLLWSSICFIALAANNVLLIIDLVIIPSTDLSIYRAGTALVGFGILLYGLIWDTE
jgi:Family of unknown function (DUF5985)